MTAYIGLCLEDRIEILTDTAQYDQKGVVRGFHRKVHALPRHNVAIVTRGGVAMGERVKEMVESCLDQFHDFDKAITVIGMVMRNLEREGTFETFASKFEVMIAGFSETKGPIIHFGSTMPLAELEAFELHATTVGVSCGAPFYERVRQQIVERGGARAMGPILMEGLRHKSGDTDFSIVGGAVDYTVLRPGQIVTEQIHNWNDQIGQKLNLQAPANISSIAGRPMSRQQRRAADAQAKKRKAS